MYELFEKVSFGDTCSNDALYARFRGYTEPPWQIMGVGTSCVKERRFRAYLRVLSHLFSRACILLANILCTWDKTELGLTHHSKEQEQLVIDASMVYFKQCGPVLSMHELSQRWISATPIQMMLYTAVFSPIEPLFGTFMWYPPWSTKEACFAGVFPIFLWFLSSEIFALLHL